MEFPSFSFSTESTLESSLADSRINESDKILKEEEQQENLLVIKELSTNIIIKYKSLKFKDMFHLQGDCIVDLEHYEKMNDLDYWIDQQNPLFIFRPVYKILKYKDYCAYINDSTTEGLTNSSAVIKRLLECQNQQAYQLAHSLQNAEIYMNQQRILFLKLRGIFGENHFRKILNDNYEKSFDIARSFAENLTQKGNKLFCLIVFRICPQSLSYKISATFHSHEGNQFFSSDQSIHFYSAVLRNKLPYFFDARSFVDLSINFFYDKGKVPINLITLDEEVVPCVLEFERVPLSHCEVSPGLFISDFCMIQKYIVNPKMIENIQEKRMVRARQLKLQDKEYLDTVQIFKDKFYEINE